MTQALTLVPFYGSAIEAIQHEGQPHVVVRRVCEHLGIDLESQRKKLKTKAWAGAVIITAPSGGGSQEAFCLPLRAFPMWLASITPSKVRPEIRPTLEAYQREAADVLYRYFLGTAGSAPLPKAEICEAVRAEIQDTVRTELKALQAPSRQGLAPRSSVDLAVQAEIVSLRGEMATLRGEITSLRAEVASQGQAQAEILRALERPVCLEELADRMGVRVDKLRNVLRRHPEVSALAECLAPGEPLRLPPTLARARIVEIYQRQSRRHRGAA